MFKLRVWSVFFLVVTSGMATSASGQELWKLRARHSDKCINVHEASFANGAAITQWDCSAAQPNMKMRKLPATGGAFKLQFTHSDKCAQVNEASHNNDAPITQWNCLNQNNVLWRIRPAKDGFFFIVNVESGKCLHQKDATFQNGGLITQWDCLLDRPNTQWKLEGW